MSKNHLNEVKDISVLIIEDEPVLAVGLEYTLKSFGYKVAGISSNMQNTLQLLLQQKVDIVLVDIKLKGGHCGIEIANYLWQQKKIPVIFLTSYCDEKTIEKTMSCEPYGYLIKPCKDQELHTTIQTSLHKHHYFFNHKECFTVVEEFLQFNEEIKYDKGKSILYIHEKPVKLTGNETKLLQLLSEFPNEVVPFERISSYIWRENIYDLGKLRTLIYRLKQKLNADIIESIFEAGYKLKVQ